MDEISEDLNEQLQRCMDQQSISTYEIAKLQAKIESMEAELESLRSAQGEGNRVHSSVEQLKRVFKAHLQCAHPYDKPSRYLLLFYAIECGLKCIYLRTNSQHSTQDIEPALLKSHGHDLARWCRLLGLSSRLSPPTTYLRSIKGKVTPYAIDRAHEVWRYGVDVNREDQMSVVAWLIELSQWISERQEIR